jgi:hypothetical protein
VRAAPLIVNHRRLKPAVFGGALTAVLVALASMVPMPKADATPAFARQTGKNCVFCHQGVPRLNDTGLAFKANGFALPDNGATSSGERKDAPAQ